MAKNNNIKSYWFDNIDYICTSFKPIPKEQKTKVSQNYMTVDEMLQNGSRIPLVDDDFFTPRTAAASKAASGPPNDIKTDTPKVEAPSTEKLQ